MKLISIIKDGRRVDMPIEKFQKVLEDTKEKLSKPEGHIGSKAEVKG